MCNVACNATAAVMNTGPDMRHVWSATLTGVLRGTLVPRFGSFLSHTVPRFGSFLPHTVPRFGSFLPHGDTVPRFGSFLPHTVPRFGSFLPHTVPRFRTHPGFKVQANPNLFMHKPN